MRIGRRRRSEGASKNWVKRGDNFGKEERGGGRVINGGGSGDWGVEHSMRTCLDTTAQLMRH